MSTNTSSRHQAIQAITPSKQLAVITEALCGAACTRTLPEVQRKRALRAILRIITPFVKPRIGAFHGFQRERIWRFISDLPEFLETACRSGAKTQDFVIASFILCLGEPGTSALWLAGNTEQLEEALKKIDWLLPVFTGRARATRTRISHAVLIFFANGSTLKFNPMSATSGGRYNLVVYDEGGKVVRTDLKKSYLDAKGLAYGTFDHPCRERHCTTLAYNSAIVEVYETLEPMGLVFKLPVDHCPWAWEKYQRDPRIQKMPAWWRNIEFWCVMDAAGGKVFTRDPVILQATPGEIIELVTRRTGYWWLKLSIDWNPSWGDAATAMLYDQTADEYFVLEEVRAPSVDALVAFMLKWQRHPVLSKRCFTTSEANNFAKDRDLLKGGVRIDTSEPWDGLTQGQKITWYQSAVERDAVFYLPSCTYCISQHKSFHFDENNKVPRQEDHMMDSIAHGIEAPADIDTFQAIAEAYGI